MSCLGLDLQHSRIKNGSRNLWNKDANSRVI